jgi:voltage-gated potassium channel Kch
VQAVLVILLFPVLFVYAENGAIQHKVERATGVEFPEEEHRIYTYSDGLYWSLVTAGTVGYGDVTPVTNLGRALAAMLGVMGVLTSGVIAGLILQWIVPRQLDG